MKHRESIEFHVYRSTAGEYYVSSESMKRLGTVKGESLAIAMLRMAEAIEADTRRNECNCVEAHEPNCHLGG